MTSLRSIFVVRLAESGGARAIVTYSPLGAGAAGITAYYLGAGPKIETRDLGALDFNDEKRVADSEALQKRV